MLRTRVIPCLLLREDALVKTIKFKKYNYIGDPENTVRIFNELEVDELVFLDILASKTNQKIKFNTLKNIAAEAFMPLAYGGGIRTFEEAKKILSIGYEKLIINSSAVESPEFITELSMHFGNQSIIGSIDVKKNFFGKYKVVTHGASKKTGLDPVEWAVELEKRGVGELLITSVDKEGTWNGYDVELIKQISKHVTVPVVANGGAASVENIQEVVKVGGASAAAVGSMVVYQKKGYGVLVNFPDNSELEKLLE